MRAGEAKLSPNDPVDPLLLETTGQQRTVGNSAALSAGGSPVATFNTKPLFRLMVEKRASDLFFTPNAPIKIKIEGNIIPINKQILSPETVRQTAYAIMNSAQREQFMRDYEIDFALSEHGLGRFRVNIFLQRGYPAIVLRFITADMPRLEALGLPEIL